MSEGRAIEMIVAQVQARLDAQLRDNDALDVKALGVLAADAAAIGVLVAAHDSINRFWWIPAILLVAAGLLLMYVVWPRELDEGPNWREFYERFGGGTAVEVGRQMLSELLASIEENALRAPSKSLLLKLASVLIVGGLGGSIVVGLLR